MLLVLLKPKIFPHECSQEKCILHNQYVLTVGHDSFQTLYTGKYDKNVKLSST